ncbi:hypothetical protein C8J56DRAFT_1005180 [Mycena floridula]|nr:hypothetical protein C8J56DRAFT_1005180 [Mycena floridula]
MGNAPSLPPQSVAGSPLQLCLNGVFSTNLAAVSYPQDILYQLDAVKPYNLDIPIVPAAVIRPSTAEDVAAAIQCAVESSVKVQARGGGHSYANYCLGGEDGALVVDMINFQKFEMDDTTWQATIGSGTLLDDVTKRLHDAGGRAMAHGTCPQVGIGGHATIGPVSRLWGSALDHVLEVEVVLANSTITRASETVNPDIFWAIKGAAAGFGVVTEFVVKTHPEITEVVQYSYSLSLGSHAAMAQSFATWQNVISDPSLTRKLATEVVVFELGMIISGTFFGTKDEYDTFDFESRLAGNATVKTTVIKDWLGVVANWAENEALQLAGGISGAFYSKSLTFTNSTLIPMSGIENLFKFFDSDKGTLSQIWFAIFDLEAGAVNDVAQDATAYAHRDALFYLQTYAVGLFGMTDTIRNFITGINQIIQDSMPGVDFGAYAGYVDPALENAQAKYWGSNLPRLEAIKTAIDPNDVFHNPQSVRPTGSAAVTRNLRVRM